MKDDSDNFLNFNEFQIKFNLKACPLKYYGLLSLLKSLWSTCQNNSNNNSVYESFSSKILKPLSGSRLIYKKLLSSKCITPPSQNKWLKDLTDKRNHEHIKWHETYQLASKHTKSTKLIDFQVKFLHRRIATNNFLTKIGIKDCPKCTFCGNELETLLHLFWYCFDVSSFWNSLTVKLATYNIIPEHYSLHILVALGLRPDSSTNRHQINFCFLLARYYIWISKKREFSPKIEGFLKYLKSVYDTESTTTTPPKKWNLLASML